jgi:conjugative transfer pilus assembly protein TraH
MVKFLLLLVFCSTPLFGNLNKDMNKFFNRFGASANVNEFDVVQGQQAGYLSGGGVSVKGRVNNVKLGTIDMPSFDAGCGGIDIFSGGFSFINAKELEENLKNIASASIGYAFMLGIETLSPQIAKGMKELQHWQSMINRHNINSCEMASALIDHGASKASLSKANVCKRTGGLAGIYRDEVMGREACAQKTEFKEQMVRLQEDPANEGVLLEEHNIAWEVLSQYKFLKDDPDLMAIFQTLVGTVVRREVGETLKVESYPSRANEEEFLKILLEGGTTKVYKCLDSVLDKRCLRIVQENITLPPVDSLTGKVRKQLETIRSKIVEDKPLDTEDINFIVSQKIPVLKVITIMAAYRGGQCPIDIFHLAETIAMDMMLRYAREVIDFTRKAAEHLEAKQSYITDIQAYITRLSVTEQEIVNFEVRVKHQNDRYLEIIRTADMLEKKIESEMEV